MSSTPSAFQPYTHYEPAVGHWPWPSHSQQQEIQSHKLTIPKVLQYLLEGDNVVSFLLQPTANFNKGPISTTYNQGPYIDILGCSFEPSSEDGCACIYDSAPSTAMRSYTREVHKSVNFSVNLGFNANIPNTNTNAIPGAGIAIGKSIGTQFNNSEFDELKYQDKKKKIVIYRMSVAYSNDDPRKYNVKDLKTLIRKRHYLGIDFLRVPPQCATSSVGAHWELKYSFPVNTEQQFKWITEVRTVFASNDWNVRVESSFGKEVNWIKTVHRIVQVFTVKINEDNTLTIVDKSRKVRQIRSTGYGTHTRTVNLKKNNNNTVTTLNSRNAQDHCFITF